MSKKKFLLVAPRTFELYKLIVQNLKYMGYEVVHIEDEGYRFKYKSFGQRLYNLIRKVLFGDRGYKEKLRKKHTSNMQWHIIHEHRFFDIAFILRADFFDKKLIEAIREKSSLLLSFHFDGVSRNPEVLDYVDYFDRFYVFDKEDINKYPSYKLLFSPNFYFDYPELTKGHLSNHSHDVFYVSTYHQSRVKSLIKLHQFLVNYYGKVKFVVVCSPDQQPNLPKYVIQHMEVRHTYLLFEEQLYYVSTAEIIVDLVIADHSGYSFRILEGIKYGKKVITTNEKVIEADFYHPNNFFILRDENYSELDSFLKLPYCSIERKIIAKYSFSKWLDDKIMLST